jgi:hypothetical protein
MMNLRKQNEGMETSFKNKGIQFTPSIIDKNDNMQIELSLLLHLWTFKTPIKT